MTTSLRGSCLCGTVTFTLKRVTGPFEICHCSRCRKVTGGQGMPAIGCHPDDYEMTSGADNVTVYEAPIIHEPPCYHVWFCRNCGSPLPDPEPKGSFMEIPAGLLDSDPGLIPERHIFVEHLPSWDRIADDLPQLTREELVTLRKQDT